jgi:pilus assembly protein CpaE
MEEKIRVIVVDDIGETRQNITRMLKFESDIEVIGGARSGVEAMELCQQDKPDVVIMDINMPDMDGITATEKIRRKFPFIQVIILSIQNDPSYMRKAMVVGARDFLSKPPMLAELTHAIRSAGKMAKEEKEKANQSFSTGSSSPGTSFTPGRGSKGKVVVVYSPKGGTGCTTIATNLAVSLNTSETKVILVDANLQYGDVAIFLNEQVKNSILEIAPRVDDLDEEVIREVVLKHAATGLNVLAAPPRPEYANRIVLDQFVKLVQFLRQYYAYIVIDTSSYLSDVVQAALDNADVIVLITSQDIPSVKNCHLFLALADGSGIKRERIVFLMNKYDKRISISPERVGENLRQEVLVTVPIDEKVASTAITRGIPFIIDSKALPIGKSILSLTDIVKNRIIKLQELQEAAAKN